MRTETLAIVFTDIKGYTAATSSQTHQENATMLKRIERLVAPVVRAYNGRVVKSIGDAYMIVFSSPTEAVRCACAVQDRLHQHNAASAADQGIHIRIAMNIGEVRVHRGDVFGEPVNIAARIESITPADEIYVSEAIYLTMNRSDLPTERVGEYELKGIPEPVTVYRVRQFGYEAEVAAPGAPDGAETVPKVRGLPYGGAQLGHWKRMRWLRRAYISMWALAVVGVAGAAYIRYRPSEDFSGLVAEVKDAVEANQPMEALAKAGEIPATATQEHAMVRPYRRQAVKALIASADIESARTEVEALLRENDRDAEALLLRAIIQQKNGQDRAAIDSLTAALKMSEAVGARPEVIDIVVRGYLEPNARRHADALVERFLKQAAVEPLLRALADNLGDRLARNAMAQRLERLGAGAEVDWVALAIEDLRSTSCKVRKAAIARLQSESDERAVGPLMKLGGDAKACGSTQAKDAANRILGK